MSLLSHRTTCRINAIDMHKTPRFHETDSTEPHVNNGCTKYSMIFLHKNTIILNTKYEEWNSYLSRKLFINTAHEVIKPFFKFILYKLILPRTKKQCNILIIIFSQYITYSYIVTFSMFQINSIFKSV